ncbi:hypothetical protein MXL46_07615 [Heyndrickxia sporothermodurans]|nr:hypothetical protein [Heyndrickxia sporothermodurans]MBL5766398.1 hypothetical protein [Heyndrickxia sporothermodurans]MBL5769837.1 hypothetical protein [Heyndrickxia sporothermodurans]MBL5776916.1 hypothetical protein [Heyndrickxia sporothermodurans]MBL5782283.1 hypothetical protein [Heyndrickxia sporothermodurans]MBL5784206.1 hypothetical protein [Heyndrickxia sporothermodurans]
MKRPIKLLGIIFLSLAGIFFIAQIILTLSIGTGLGKDDMVGFSKNKYVIGRPPTSYNLYEKDSGITILDNVIGYKKGKAASYIRNDIEYVIINEEKGNYSKRELKDASTTDIKQLKKVKRLE